MKLLWVKAGGLLPPDTGGKIRSFHILKQLARRHDITLFTFYPEHPGDLHPAGSDIFSKVVAVPLPLPPRRSLSEYARSARLLMAGQPFTVYKYFYPVVYRRYAELLQSAAFDLIVCDFLVPAPLIDWKTPPPKILFTHNVEAEVWARHAKVATNPLMKLACRLESSALQRAERRYVQLADYVLAVSENNRASFAPYVDPSRIAVIPTGVDTEYFTPTHEPEQPNTMAFTGSMDWRPNEDGVAYFVDKILPLIREQIPQAVFWAVGRMPSRRLQALASDHVVVTGAVDDIRPYLAKAALCVVPLRSGSGTRIKIFEAMAMGKAVVSTTLGAEGLPVQHGENIILADDPADFTREVVALLHDPPRRQRLGQAARKLVEESYGWPSVAACFEGIMESCTSTLVRRAEIFAPPRHHLFRTILRKILIVFGTRPEAIKLCPVLLKLRQSAHFEVRSCVTAQHRSMLDQVLAAFEVTPDHDLDLMQPGQTLAQIAARILAALESVIHAERPDLVLVQGDTTTTFTAALAAFYQHVPVGHVEAGLRTGDLAQPFPEEMNRLVATRLSCLHFAPTEAAAKNLLAENVDHRAIFVTGNSGIDAVLYVRDALAAGRLPVAYWPQLDPTKKLIVVTAHRRESFGSGFERICEALARLARRQNVQLVYPVHHNPHAREIVHRRLDGLSNVFLVEPLGYVPFVDLMCRARLLITDSGGIQEEGPSLGKPILVMREKTERPEAVAAGTVKLVGTNPDCIVREAERLLDDDMEYRRVARIHNPYGDGRASGRICQAMEAYFGYEHSFAEANAHQPELVAG